MKEQQHIFIPIILFILFLSLPSLGQKIPIVVFGSPNLPDQKASFEASDTAKVYLKNATSQWAKFEIADATFCAGKVTFNKEFLVPPKGTKHLKLKLNQEPPPLQSNCHILVYSYPKGQPNQKGYPVRIYFKLPMEDAPTSQTSSKEQKGQTEKAIEKGAFLLPSKHLYGLYGCLAMLSALIVWLFYKQRQVAMRVNSLVDANQTLSQELNNFKHHISHHVSALEGAKQEWGTLQKNANATIDGLDLRKKEFEEFFERGRRKE